MTVTERRRATEPRWGRQPAYDAARRFAEGEFFDPPNDEECFELTAMMLSHEVGFEVKHRTLRAWLEGRNTPPAEIKLGLAEVLCAEPEELWTPAVMEAVYSGPRGFRPDDNRRVQPPSGRPV